MSIAGQITHDTRGINVSRRIAFAAVALLLLLQAAPVLACVAMPAQMLTACCCEADGNCPMAARAAACAGPDACCVQATGSTPALSVSAAHPDDRSLAHPIGPGVLPATDLVALIERCANQHGTQLYQHHSAPLPAVPLYLRHLRLTL
jgi:hypothetical protein